jgi:hypothetical protein
MHSFPSPPRLALLGLIVPLFLAGSPEPIDREALVRRHIVIRTAPAALVYEPPRADLETPAEPRYAPLQVGNGEFAFGFDLTGLQTFIPANTLSHGAWHTTPHPDGLGEDDFQLTRFPDDAGREIPYPWLEIGLPRENDLSSPEMSEAQRQLGFWLRANPHPLNLARVALDLRHPDGSSARLEDLTDLHQELDLWTGIATSRFRFDGQPFVVITCAHPERDALAVRITSPALSREQAAVSLKFPYGESRKQTADVGDWHSPEKHATTLETLAEGAARLHRRIDQVEHSHTLSWSGEAALAESGPHHFTLRPSAAARELEFVLDFRPPPPRPLDFAEVRDASARHWPAFWRSGGAIDLSGSTDARAHELERRIVLSQYLAAVNTAGSFPPQEAGLVNFGWHGKAHLEMIWWHLAHYALWDRWDLARPGLEVYGNVLERALETARRQGYAGARWPKMIGPGGRESPSSVNPFLLWQQPHPLFFAELDYRAHPTAETLRRWDGIVAQTAVFMADLPLPYPADGYLHLGPPLKTMSENAPLLTTRDPAFELGYWRWGLAHAIRWQQRQGKDAPASWRDTLARLAPLPVADGRYLLSATQPDTYTAYAWEHPALAGLFGLLPGNDVDRATMEATLDGILAHWDFDRVWGWDFPMLAMCAARLGRPEVALDFLLHDSPRFQFADNGLATGGPWPYFPSNGGLLYAAAFLAAGWDGAPEGLAAPGFPRDGSWTVRAEGLRVAP